MQNAAAAPVESSLAAPQVAQTDLSHDTAKKLLCISTRKLKPYSLETLWICMMALVMTAQPALEGQLHTRLHEDESWVSSWMIHCDSCSFLRSPRESASATGSCHCRQDASPVLWTIVRAAQEQRSLESSRQHRHYSSAVVRSQWTQHRRLCTHVPS